MKALLTACRYIINLSISPTSLSAVCDLRSMVDFGLIHSTFFLPSSIRYLSLNSSFARAATVCMYQNIRSPNMYMNECIARDAISRVTTLASQRPPRLFVGTNWRARLHLFPLLGHAAVVCEKRRLRTEIKAIFLIEGPRLIHSHKQDEIWLLY